ncbi:hypothetical protein OHS70_00445 [Streptomyces sp. NBC_00390]|uniref:hypothetical protein n=1 Tax=Streptomyces sp. NBC_00390 TaxID=2975736 RepID=UPI002E1C520F
MAAPDWHEPSQTREQPSRVPLGAVHTPDGPTPPRPAPQARTREYVARQTASGRTKKEIIRLLKRAIAREIHHYLTTPVTVPDVADLRGRSVRSS